MAGGHGIKIQEQTLPWDPKALAHPRTCGP